MYRIQVEKLCKDFRIYARPQDRLKELVLRKQYHRLFHVLQDVSFQVPDGSSLGIVGNNGAGKSTLMRLLVGTLQPTSGTVDIHGQVAALLELGAGFHPEFSGRRNIYLNASLLGVPDDNIAELENEIIEFSELRDFIDQPVKTYSSGMYVRLAFSIATMVRPDVLVIDEALSVGDIAFQTKCVQRMNQFREQNKTMVFCSHSMYHVQELCDTAIWMEKGRIRAIGNSEEIVGMYEDFSNSRKVYSTPDTTLRKPAGEPKAPQDSRVLQTVVRNLDGEIIETADPLQDLILEIQVEVLNDNVHCYFGFALMKNLHEFQSSYLATDLPEVENGPFRKGEIITVQVRLHGLAMRTGSFNLLGGVADPSGLLWYDTKLSKEVRVNTVKGLGPLVMRSDWTVIRGTEQE